MNSSPSVLDFNSLGRWPLWRRSFGGLGGSGRGSSLDGSHRLDVKGVHVLEDEAGLESLAARSLEGDPLTVVSVFRDDVGDELGFVLSKGKLGALEALGD